MACKNTGEIRTQGKFLHAPAYLAKMDMMRPLCELE